MTWLILLFFAAFGVAYLLRRRRGKAELEAALEYRFSFEADEVFRGEYLTLCQTVINRSARPIPFLKLETLMPEGLELVLAGEKTETVRSAESIWTLRPEEQIERRWRVLAKKRGIYAAESVELHAVSNDPLGANEFSLLLKPAEGGKSTLRVLPCAAEEIRNLALTAALTGDASQPQGILRDPMAYAGVRAYTPSDPLGSVDWKQSAKLGYPVVRQCEAVRNDAYQVVLNMQTVIIEPHPPAVTSPQYIEDCITVCASLLDSAAGRNIPVRLFANTDPAGLSSGSAAGEDGIAAHGSLPARNTAPATEPAGGLPHAGGASAYDVGSGGADDGRNACRPGALYRRREHGVRHDLSGRTDAEFCGCHAGERRAGDLFRADLRAECAADSGGDSGVFPAEQMDGRCRLWMVRETGTRAGCGFTS